MKRQIYKSGSRSNKTFIYQVKFGKLLPLVILSSEPEYFRIKTRFELLADSGELMSFGIHPTSRAFVERLEKLDLAQDSEEAERRQQTWMKDLNALNWERTPQTVLSELFEVEETPQQAEQAAKLQETHRKEFSIENPSFEEFVLLDLRQKYPQIHERIKERWERSKGNAGGFNL
jgi:hypothetical protein